MIVILFYIITQISAKTRSKIERTQIFSVEIELLTFFTKEVLKSLVRVLLIV